MLKKVGLTLLELIVVLVILAALAGLAVGLMSSTTQWSREKATESTLSEIKSGIELLWIDIKPLGVLQADVTLDMLLNNDANRQVFDPVTKIGWRGPYIKPIGSTQNGFSDAWQKPISMWTYNNSGTTFVAIVSGGDDQKINTPTGTDPNDPNAVDNDDLFVVLPLK